MEKLYFIEDGKQIPIEELDKLSVKKKKKISKVKTKDGKPKQSTDGSGSDSINS